MKLSEVAQPVLILLVGLPASGKSTWIRSYISKHPDQKYVIISSDDIIEELGSKDGLNYADAWKKYANQATKEMNRRADVAFQNKNNIIWDQTNLFPNSRRGKINRAKGYKKFAVVFQPDPTEHARRYAQRTGETGKTIPQDVMNKMASDFVMPTSSEGFDKIVTVR